MSHASSPAPVWRCLLATAAAWSLVSLAALFAGEQVPAATVRQPTNDETYMVELINRARADPMRELAILLTQADAIDELTSNHPVPNVTGYTVIRDVARHFSSHDADANELWTDFNAIVKAPPLAIRTELIKAAEAHNLAMIAADTQSHQLPGEAHSGARMKAAGYPYNGVAECIYAYCTSADFGHAGFEIDWGVPSDIHRKIIHTSSHRDVGVAITPENSSTTGLGPLVITQDFGSGSGSLPSFCGVVYTDGTVRDDDFYTPGEGLGDCTITARSSITSYATTTWASGGYTLQVPANDTYSVSLDWAGRRYDLGSYTIATANRKVDFDSSQSVPANIPPNVVLTSPVGSIELTAPGTIELRADASDSDGIAKVEFFAGTRMLGQDTSLPYQFTWSGIAAGTYSLTAKATDTMGLATVSSSRLLTVSEHDDCAPFQVGTAAVDHDWVSISHGRNFTNPVVITGPASRSDSAPLVVRVRNVQATSFELKLDEYVYQLDRSHPKEQVAWLVCEAGSGQIGNLRYHAGITDVSGTVGTKTANAWASVTLEPALTTVPLVFTAVTANGSDPALVRIRNLAHGGFQLGLQEEELRNPQGHIPEQVSWLALEPGSTDDDTVSLASGRFGLRSTPLSLNHGLAASAHVFAAITSYYGSDPATIRLHSRFGDVARVAIEEEASFDAEIGHVEESAAWLAIIQILPGNG